MKKLLRILLLPIVLPASLFGILFFLVIVGIVIIVRYPCGLYERYRWKQKLRQQGRLISSESILASAMPGTLIVDAPTVGWNVTYCWWTPERARDLAPMKILNKEEFRELFKSSPAELHLDSFDVWCFERYLHEEHGSALLVSASRGERLAKWLIEQRPDLQLVETYSGMMFFTIKDREFQAVKNEQNKLGEAGT